MPRKTAVAKKPTTKPKAKSVSAPLKTVASTRRVKLPKKRALRIRKRDKIKRPPVPGAFRLLWRSFKILRNHWKLFLAITIIYAVLNLLLVKGLSGENLTAVKNALQLVFKGHGGQLATGATLFVYLLGGSGNSSNASAGVYQTILIIIVSLAMIWALREVYAQRKVRARHAFYRGMYPLVPFILVMLVILLQLVPLLFGAYLYATVINAGIAVYAIEKILWALLFVALALVSLYMICSSTFALLIVTLPDMTPMKALRSARQLVLDRRFTVLRKILFLPLALLIITVLIMFPIILYATPAAVWVFFVLSISGLIIVNSYFYTLYRELL